MTGEPAERGSGSPPVRSRRPFRPLPDWARPATRLVHGGQLADLNAGAVVSPIYQTSTFHYPAEYSEAAAHGEVHIYSREGNPTVGGAADVVRELEGGEAAKLFASGMGAISATILSLVRAGDEVLAPDALYGGTAGLLTELLPRLGVRVHLLDRAATETPERAVTPSTRLAIVETPTNPLLRVHDLRRWSDAVHRVGGVLVVDNTFASPINQQPLELGADLVVHSATKYLGGHSDLTGGAVIGSSEIVSRIDPKSYLGSPLDPFAAFLLHRSLKTLGLRVAQQNRNAAALLAAVEHHPSVESVYYPGRSSVDQEAIAARQMRGRGGMLSFALRGGRPAVPQFFSALRIVQVASSLGGVESLASSPRETSHRRFTDEERRALGIPDGLVRLSVGVEDPADLVRDVEEALASTVNRSTPPL